MDSRWEEERYTDGVKWKFLEHKGPVFAPPYDPLPSKVKFYYDGKIVFTTELLNLHISLWLYCRTRWWYVGSEQNLFILNILGKHMKLSPEAEEVATFFAKMLEHEYTTKDIFRKNFFKDWRKVGEKITCDESYKCQISKNLLLCPVM